VTSKHEKNSSKGLLAARKAVSLLTSTKRAARLAFDEANQEARVSSQRVKEANAALDKAKWDMCLAKQRLEELRAEYKALKSW
jgi:uncharacterized protein (DUF3084 family)